MNRIVAALSSFAVVTVTFASGQVAGLKPPSTVEFSIDKLRDAADGVIAANTNSFTDDGSPYYSAGTVYADQGIFVDDFYLTAEQNPAAFDWKVAIPHLIEKFLSHRSADGDIPAVLGRNGQPSAYAYYSGWDKYHKHVVGDGWVCLPHLMYLAWQHNKDLRPYKAHVEHIKAALARIPRNPKSHLITVNPGDEYVPGTMFLEMPRFTGDVACANVWYMRVVQRMAELAVAAGDAQNAAFFNSELTTVANNITELIDQQSGLFTADNGQLKSNLDVYSSALFCYSGFGTADQRLAIARYFDQHFATLVNPAGYVLNSPTRWAAFGSIPPSGGYPYAPSPLGEAAKTYQDGYWSDHLNWFATTLALVNPDKARQLIATFAAGADLTCEYYNIGSAKPNGTTQNMESPQGALCYAQKHAAELHATARQ